MEGNVCSATRAKDIEEWDYDQEPEDKIYETFEGAYWVLDPTNYIGVDNYFGFREIYTLPPVSALPVIEARWQAQPCTASNLRSL